MTTTFSHGYALLIGVGQSAYAPWSLPAAARDVQAVERVLGNTDLCAYDLAHVRSFCDAQATRQAILDGLQWLSQQARDDQDATAIVYYSGHGWWSQAVGQYFLIPHDVQPFDVAASALPAQVFTQALRQVAARRLLVALDCCHSAGMTTSKGQPGAGEILPEGYAAAAPPKDYVDELKQGGGRAVFMSCRQEQKSWVQPEKNVSLYTFHLLEALEGANNRPGDRLVSLSNLMNHLQKTVPRSAHALCGAEQTPFFDLASDDFPCTYPNPANELRSVTKNLR